MLKIVKSESDVEPELKLDVPKMSESKPESESEVRKIEKS